MTTLSNERAFMGGHTSGPALDDLLALARSTGAAADPLVRQGLAAAWSRSQITRYLQLRIRTATAQGRPPGPEASVMKLRAAWNMKANAELALAIEGAGGMLAGAAAPRAGALAAALPQRPVDPHRRRQRRGPAQRHGRAGPRPAPRPARRQGRAVPGHPPWLSSSGRPSRRSPPSSRSAGVG
jgi:hypothetical protein